ncbi:type 2 lantipeptide synthetase LanM [Erwinia sp. CPCC 100877]|nr:type 2 lantipeptide synthetase LanM [Erwinia sp. CPCC 100877]
MNGLKNKEKINYWIKFFPEYKTTERKFIDLLNQTSILNENLVQLPYQKVFERKKQERVEQIIGNTATENLFPEAFLPIIAEYFEPLNQFIDEESFVLDKKQVKQTILSSLMDKLSNIGNQSLISNLTELRNQELLKGISSEDRFSYYVNEVLSDRDYLKSFYKKYEALFELLCEMSKNHFSFIKEVILQIKLNRNDINQMTEGNIEGITDFGGDLGDSHHSGKAVLTIIFNQNQKVIYKPRSLDLEMKFNQFLTALNEKNSNTVIFKTVKVLNKGHFGWMEYVPHDECENTQEIAHFYENIGQLTALLYFLNGKDFHHENIIALGKFPVLIDLESLFHADLTEVQHTETVAYEKAHSLFNNSVYSIGILPQCLKNNSYDEFISADIGGISGEKDQLSPFKSNVVFNRNRDDIYIGKEYSFIQIQKNNPLLDNQPVQATLYFTEFQKGFVAFYDWVLAHKDWFIEKVEAIFSDATSRYIAKPTFVYSQLLRTSFHPQILTSRQDRNVLLHRISIHQKEKQHKLLDSELNSLKQGDIPYFITNTSSKNIYSTDKLLVKDYFDRTPMEMVLEKINYSNKEDRNLQLNIINQVFSAKNADVEKDRTKVVFEGRPNQNIYKEDWLVLAQEIGDDILKNAISISDGQLQYLTWLGVNFEGKMDEYFELGLVNNDLYLGNSGVALFLAYLGAISKEQKYLDGAKFAANMIQTELNIITQDGYELIGAFNGISGYFYTLGKLNELLEGIYTEYLMDKLTILHFLIQKDRNFDIISGSSGCLLVLLSLYENFESYPSVQKQIKKMANQCYQHLKNNAHRAANGIHWRQHESDPLVGFAHGNAGIIYSCAKLYELTGQEEILSLIQDALIYDRQFYSRSRKGWYFSSNRDSISMGWCNGTSGILMSRLALLEIGYQDSLLKQEIAIAIDGIKKHGFGNNTSLCHGDFGNLEGLIYAAQVLGNRQLFEECLSTIQNLCDSYLRENWQFGLFKGTVSYNLMIGLSGCGYSLLQGYTNYAIPKVLLLN